MAARFGVVLGFFFCWVSFLFASDLSFLTKQKQVITLEWKMYQLPGDENIALYGAKNRKFLSDCWYWGEAGYGALSGKRSGYLEGGIFTGFLSLLSTNLLMDARLFFGAGGGGSAPQGGGMIVHPTIGLGKAVNDQHFVMLELGYIKFLNGEIESLTLGFNVNRNLWLLKERRK